MLKIFVLDNSAEGRHGLVSRIDGHFKSGGTELLVPHCEIKGVSRQELSFQSPPEVCVLSESYVTSSMADVSKIRAMLPRAALVVMSSAHAANFTAVEHLARLGVDEVLPLDIDVQTFLRKIIILSHRFSRQRKGQVLLVDSAQGGLGTSSLVAALGEATARAGKRVVMVDLDLEGRDLSRYLQARPYVNENLLMILERRRPFSREFLQQGLVNIWKDDPSFVCMPPVPRLEFDQEMLKGLSQVIESLSSDFDFVIIDAAGSRGALRRAMQATADRIVLLLNNDPANLSPAVNRAGEICAARAKAARLLVVPYSPSRYDLSLSQLQTHFLGTTDLSADCWMQTAVPFSALGRCWPASGRTIYSCGDPRVVRAIQGLLAALEIAEAPALARSSLLSCFSRTLQRLRKSRSSDENKLTTPALPAPGLRELPHTPLAIPAPLESDPLKALEQFIFEKPNAVSAGARL